MKKLCIVLVTVALLIGCESTGGGGGNVGKMGGLLSDKCPFTGEAVQPELTVWHGSDQVGFCCKKCYEKFSQMAPEERAQVVAKLK